MFSRTASAPPSQGQPQASSAFLSFSTGSVVDCPICGKNVRPGDINAHLDAGCATHIVDKDAAHDSSTQGNTDGTGGGAQRLSPPAASLATTPSQKRPASSFFQTPTAKRTVLSGTAGGPTKSTQSSSIFTLPVSSQQASQPLGVKRRFDEGPGQTSPSDSTTTSSENAPSANGHTNVKPATPASLATTKSAAVAAAAAPSGPAAKRSRTNRAAPLAERMRPRNLDDVFGQDLVGANGVLRSLIEADRVPSMILWGGSGTGKTTIARCIAQRVGSRFVEMNATSSGGVAECKKLFQDAANELTLTGRKTILFCDEIHRFTKAQQDVFLKPVEAGTITLIGATTENPSFRIVGALLSRCRTFTLAPLSTDDIKRILERAVREETGVSIGQEGATQEQATDDGGEATGPAQRATGLSLIDSELLGYLAAFSDGDARTALNLLELAMSIAARPKEVEPSSGVATALTKEDLKAALTKTLVYDRAGDQHYDTISAFHKSVRGSDADAALYYLARMLQSGEDPLFIARRMVVIASEDVGLADSSLLPLATAAYTATQQIGMPEARIPLAHCAVALALAPKSTRAYRGLNNAFAALREPGVAALPIPIHLRNAPTRLMKDMGYGNEYKYNPNYLNGRVKQDYLPDQLLERSFLEARDLGTAVDPDLED